MANKYEVELSGSVVVEAVDEIAAEDLAMNLIHGDISTWAETNADIEFNVDTIKEID